MSELLIGCGTRRDRLVGLPPGKFKDLTTLDINEEVHADILWDLNDLPLPIDNDCYDEIHAYEVLEHLGTLGDWRSFFRFWNELWRIIKDGGQVCATTPAWNSIGSFGDPGHLRIYNEMTLAFLDQVQYREQVGNTPMTDYRFVYHGDFEPVAATYVGDDTTFAFVLRAHKPARGEEET